MAAIDRFKSRVQPRKFLRRWLSESEQSPGDALGAGEGGLGVAVAAVGGVPPSTWRPNGIKELSRHAPDGV